MDNTYFLSTILSLKFCKSSVALLLMLFIYNTGLSQEVPFRIEQFTGQNGLSMNGIMNISQDEKGFLWFRTDEGIVKYDGYTFSPYLQNSKNPNAIFQMVEEIYDDQKGHIWVNYNGLGLSFLNKPLDHFKNFKPGNNDKNFIGNHDIKTYHADSTYVWIGTNYGLYAFDYVAKTIQYHDFPYALSITSLYTDNIGNLWIGTDTSNGENDGLGLYLYELSTQTLHQIRGELTETINSIFQDSRGRIWLATNLGVGKIINYSPGVLSYSQTFYQVFKYKSGSKQDRNRNEINTFIERSNGELWLTSNMGIARILEDEENLSLKYYLDEETKNDVFGRSEFQIIIEQDGMLWALSRSAHLGVCRYMEDQDKFDTKVLVRSDGSLANYQLISMYIDRNSILWVGTVRNGLLKVDLLQKKFLTFRYNDYNSKSIASNNVYGITEQSNGVIWIGTADGVSKYVPGDNGFTSYTTANSGINDNMVFSVLIDSRNNLWLGHWPTQVSKIDLRSWKNTPFKYVIENDTTDFFAWTISSIEEDDKGDVWIGSHSFGLWQSLSGEREFRNYLFEKNEFINELAIEDLFIDDEGKLWIGTSFGLYTFNMAKKELEQVLAHESDQLFQEGIYCITEVGSDLWIGTYSGGLVQLDKNELEIDRFDLDDGLAGNSVRGILSENDEYLWISTTNGLSRFNLRNKEFKNYTKEDGIQGNEFNVNSYFKSSDNTFYFGGTEGLTLFRPAEIVDNTHKAIPQLTDLYLFNEKVNIGDTINDQVVLPYSMSYLEDLVLNHINNILSIEFSCMQMTSPSKNLYKYKLEGLEEEWNLVNASKRTATYTSLPPGDYTFRLICTNNDGLWNEHEATLNIEILPPWWNSLPFRILFVLLLVGLAVVLFRLRIMNIRQKNKKLEEMVEEKTENLKEQNEEIKRMSEELQEAAQSKIGFFMNVSHEFRTPISLILGPVGNLSRSTHLSHLDKENVELIERNGHRLLRLTNQLLDSADLEKGTLKLMVAHADIVNFVNQIVHAFDFRADSMSVNYQFTANKNEFKCWFDGDKLEKILYNLISNAFKFTEHPATISIDLNIENEKLKISVSDNGIGLSDSEINNVFDRFYQADNKFQRKTGTGIGLNLAKQLAQKHKGDLTVESESGKGSKFTLEIPVDDNHYSEKERGKYQATIKDQVEQIKILSSNIPERQLSHEQRDDSLPTILHVEDSVDMRRFIKSSLQSSYVIIQAKDGIDGFKKAEAIVPDLILCDLMMPAMDGIELCDKIKENDYLSHIPIILLTAKIGEESKIEGYGVGADEYLSKPIDVALLKARINNLIESRKKLRESFSTNVDLVPKNLVKDRGDEAFLEKAIKIVEQNLSDPELSYHAFMETLGVGKTQLYNRINKISGQSINIFIRTIRLKIAARLIQEGSMSFSEISYEVGFSDPNYFSKCFKKQYGLSPKAYKEQNTG